MEIARKYSNLAWSEEGQGGIFGQRNEVKGIKGKDSSSTEDSLSSDMGTE